MEICPSSSIIWKAIGLNFLLDISELLCHWTELSGVSVRFIHKVGGLALWHSSSSPLRWNMLMAIYIHQLDDKIICHDLVSAELQAKTLKGCNIFGTEQRENILPEFCRGCLYSLSWCIRWQHCQGCGIVSAASPSCGADTCGSLIDGNSAPLKENYFQIKPGWKRSAVSHVKCQLKKMAHQLD